MEFAQVNILYQIKCVSNAIKNVEHVMDKKKISVCLVLMLINIYLQIIPVYRVMMDIMFIIKCVKNVV